MATSKRIRTQEELGLDMLRQYLKNKSVETLSDEYGISIYTAETILLKTLNNLINDFLPF